MIPSANLNGEEGTPHPLLRRKSRSAEPPDGRREATLRRGVTVAQMILVHLVRVRILTPQQEKYCGVEQWSARLSHKQEVVSNGSNPTHRNKRFDQPKAISHYRVDQPKAISHIRADQMKKNLGERKIFRIFVMQMFDIGLFV